MAAATPEQAVAHPNWSMGAKISVDSATMMNKGLELIEAHHLFGLPSERIDILVHPQSVIHSMVEYVDGSVLAQLGSPDMRIPIAHALAWPERMETPAERLDLARIGTLDVRSARPGALSRAAPGARGARGGRRSADRAQCRQRGSGRRLPRRRIGFLDIVGTVEEALARTDAAAPQSIADVIDIDREARALARDLMSEMAA